MTYAISWTPQAQRQAHSLDATVARRVFAAVARLAVDPRPSGVKKLVGADDLWRIRVGDWRVIYRVRDAELIVLIVRVAHRRESYQ